MVNRGEEKVRVHMNVVPRSTGNTNSGTRELTLKCKIISSTIIYTSELILWFHYLCSQCYAAQHSYKQLKSSFQGFITITFKTDD